MRDDRSWLPWRFLCLILGLLLVVSPLGFPLVELFCTPAAWKVWSEWDRLADLFANTLIVALGSSLVAIILGSVTAILLVRTSLAARWYWSLLLSAGLFIPLPMLLSGWYLLVQSAGAPMPALWSPPWQMLGTILIHAMLGLPWAILILSLGLLWIEPELEEEMLLYASFPRVLRHIILPRCWPFVSMAALIVSWPAWHEITVTDFFKVRTLAEEVYLQLNNGSMEEAPRAMASMVPFCLLLMLLTLLMMRWWRRRCPANWPSNARQQRLLLGRWQVTAQVWMLLVLCLLLILPCSGLILRAGMEYGPANAWSICTVIHRVGSIILAQGAMISHSLLIAGFTGLLTAGTMIFLVWLARSSSRLDSCFWVLAALLWAVPGPMLGIGLLSMILWLISLPGGMFFSSWLYSEPSPLPNIWAAWLRFLPLAWLALWPMARLIPSQWEEEAWLDGASPWRRLCLLYWPRLRMPALAIALAVALLTLGEISAGKLVTTPGYLPLSQHLFQQMHAGADTEVAALSLTLLLPLMLTLLGGGTFLGCRFVCQFWKRLHVRLDKA